MSSKKALLILLLITALGLILRIIAAKQIDCLWFDEIFGIHFSQLSMAEITHFIAQDNFHPPLYFYLLHFWLKLSSSEIVIRLFSIIFGTLSIPLFYKLIKKIYSTQFGLMAAFLVSISPFHIVYSREVKMYSLLIFFSLISIYYFYLILQKEKQWPWVIYILANIAMIYTHYFGWLLLLVQNLFFFIYRRQIKIKKQHWILSQCLVVISFLPWFFYSTINKILTFNSEFWALNNFIPNQYFFQTISDLFAFSHDRSLYLQLLRLVIFLFLIVTLIWYIKKGVKTQEPFIKHINYNLFFFLLFIIPTLVGFIARFYQPKYIICSSLGLYVLIILAINFYKHLPRFKIYSLIIIGMIGFVVYIYEISFTKFYCEEVAQYVETNEGEGDRIITHYYPTVLPFGYYYQGKSPYEGFYPINDALDFDTRIVNHNSMAPVVNKNNVSALSEVTKNNQRIWLVTDPFVYDPEELVLTWFQDNDDLIPAGYQKFGDIEIYLFNVND